MKLLHRYLLRELLLATLVGVSLFAFVLLAGTALKDIIGRAADGVLPLAQAASMLAGLTPFVLTYALPMGLLTAILITLGRISALHEITAMRAAGLGITRIGSSALLIAGLGAGLSLVINFSYAPAAKAHYREVLHQVVRTDPMKLIVPGTFVRDFRDIVVYVGSRDGDVLRDIWLWKSEDHRPDMFAWAEQGELQPGADDEHIEVAMRNASIFAYDPRHPGDFSGYKPMPSAGLLPVELRPSTFVRQEAFQKKVSWLTLGELLRERQRLAGAPARPDQLRLLEVKMSLHEKAAMGLSVFAFALVGVPLALRTGRKESSVNLAIALGLSMAWYGGMLVVTWFDDRPDLHPELWQWLPNLGFLALGSWMWWRFGRN